MGRLVAVVLLARSRKCAGEVAAGRVGGEHVPGGDEDGML